MSKNLNSIDKDNKLMNDIFEAIKLNNKESAIYLTKELIKNQTDENRISSLEQIINSLL